VSSKKSVYFLVKNCRAGKRHFMSHDILFWILCIFRTLKLFFHGYFFFFDDATLMHCQETSLYRYSIFPLDLQQFCISVCLNCVFEVMMCFHILVLSINNKLTINYNSSKCHYRPANEGFILDYKKFACNKLFFQIRPNFDQYFENSLNIWVFNDYA
jgi:hypothetical protein